MTSAADTQAIQSILTRLESAWNVYDSASFAAEFVEDAIFIHVFGGQLDGRDAITASHRRIFDTIYKGSRVSMKLEDVRFVRPDVAIALTSSRLEFPGRDDAPHVEARPTMIVAKEQGDWRIVAFQNTKISELPAGARP